MRLPLALVMLALPAATRPVTPHPLSRPPSVVVTTRATGTFDVKINPFAADDYADGAMLGRMSLDKVFRGDLDATSKGQMLTGMTSVKNSAGYVAIERVTGTLHGRSGSFILQHFGTMNKGAQHLTITIVPDSGTEGLAGISGTMKIIIDGKVHRYEMEYALPAK